MHGLLRTGCEFEFEGSREVIFSKKIAGTELGWCLGAGIKLVGGVDVQCYSRRHRDGDVESLRLGVCCNRMDAGRVSEIQKRIVKLSSEISRQREILAPSSSWWGGCSCRV
ncbi:hypothetical protein B0H11DRAFT_2193180 [Mycena galericulata]|nr:hypothetical protein B0H11DRAFT_2193180 [Mycena galericulata]